MDHLSETAPATRIFLTVGTDHHPFTRLIEWTDEWAGANGVGDQVLAQTGTSITPVNTRSTAYLGHDEIEGQYAETDVIVTHGGAATIMAVRRSGKIPIVVPREPSLGEHVDHHQVAIATRFSNAGFIVLARTKEEYVRSLDHALRDPLWLRRRDVDEGDSARLMAVATFRRLADDLTAHTYRRSTGALTRRRRRGVR